MKKTGFNAYTNYIFIKQIHFKDNDFNIVCGLRLETLREKYLAKWNKSRRNKDGEIFQRIEEKYPSNYVQKLLFSTYYLDDKHFYIRSILEDDYKLFKESLYYLKNVEDNFTIALERVIINCIKEKIKIKDLLISEKYIPEIFNLDLTFNSLAILDSVFNFAKLNKNIELNLLEEETWNETLINLRKYRMIIDRFIKNIDWENKLKIILKRCHAR